MKKNGLNIIYEDSHLLAINKVAGMLTLPDRYNTALPSYLGLLKEKYSDIYIVHRLDVGTSGVLLFAKDAQTHAFLSKQFTNHTLQKTYTAVLDGILRVDEQVIDIPLLANPNKRGGVIPSARGKASITKIKVLERFNFSSNNYRGATLIEAELQTGRLHQLRAHTATIGYPLLIDNLYGNRADFFTSAVKRRYNVKKKTEEQPLISRPTLHATKIKFTHISNEIITITADFPRDFAALLQILQKYSRELPAVHSHSTDAEV